MAVAPTANRRIADALEQAGINAGLFRLGSTVPRASIQRWNARF
jgi:hypothetical protein